MTIWTNKEGLIGSKKRALAAGLLAAAVTATSLLAAVEPAQAAFPGKNGTIVFYSDRTTGEGVDNPEGDDEIFTINPDGTGLKQLTKNDLEDESPAYSKGGKQIAFTRNNGDRDIFKMNADGSDQKQLTFNDVTDDFAVWSPNGKQIAFQSERDSTAFNSDIIKMNALDGSGQKNLTNTPDADDLSPNWSPNGKQIAFGSDRDGGFDIIKMNALDGSDQENLTSTPNVGDFLPAFSPDGKQIAFESDDDIFKMKADGSGQENLTSTPDNFELEPDWQPIKKK